MCDRFVFTQEIPTNTNKQSYTQSCHHPSGLSPVFPVLVRGQQVSHWEENLAHAELLAVDQTVPIVKDTHTHSHSACTQIYTCLCTWTHTQKRWHTHTHTAAACFSFLTGWQRTAGCTPTRLCYPLAFNTINLCNMKHKYAHKPTGIQYRRREKGRGGERIILAICNMQYLLIHYKRFLHISLPYPTVSLTLAWFSILKVCQIVHNFRFSCFSWKPIKQPNSTKALRKN